jgi:mannan polymerase II complex MNN11 subunit
MHFALPPRKTSQPPPFARVHAKLSANARRRTLQVASYAVLGVLTLYLIFHYLSHSSKRPLKKPDSIPPNQEITIVTVLDESSMSDSYISMIRRNRDDYARRHDYHTFYTNVSTYSELVGPSPSSWSLVPALRHAIKRHPTSNYLWSLTPHALITKPSLDIHTHILSNLSSLMQKDIPIVPPDSVIKTYAHTTATSAYMVLSQDMDNLAHTSFLLKNTPPNQDPPDGSSNWALFLLDSWFDPLYRSYAFHLADLHALEHLIQWHTTITTHIAVVPQRMLNSYNYAFPPRKITGPDGHILKDEKTGEDLLREHDSMWSEGDLVVNFKGCEDAKAKAQGRDCEQEMGAYFKRWLKEVERLDGGQAETASVGN